MNVRPTKAPSCLGSWAAGILTNSREETSHLFLGFFKQQLDSAKKPFLNTPSLIIHIFPHRSHTIYLLCCLHVTLPGAEKSTGIWRKRYSKILITTTILTGDLICIRHLLCAPLHDMPCALTVPGTNLWKSPSWW